MRILFVTTLFPLPVYGGEQLLLAETIRCIQEQCDVHILAPEPTWQCDPESLLRENGLKATPHFFCPRKVEASFIKGLAIKGYALCRGSSYIAESWTSSLRGPLNVALDAIVSTNR